MNDSWNLVVAAFIGASLGAIFYGGLWWTIRRALSSARPALWFLGSLLLRTAIVLAGFYFIGRGRWEPMLECLLGFFIARVVVTRLTRAPDKPTHWVRQVPHAS